MAEEKKISVTSNKDKEKEKEKKPNKEINPPKFFLIPDGVYGVTETVSVNDSSSKAYNKE